MRGYNIICYIILHCTLLYCISFYYINIVLVYSFTIIEHGWKPHRDVSAQKRLSQASSWHTREQQKGRVSSNSRFQTVYYVVRSSTITVITIIIIVIIITITIMCICISITIYISTSNTYNDSTSNIVTLSGILMIVLAIIMIMIILTITIKYSASLSQEDYAIVVYIR